MKEIHAIHRTYKQGDKSLGTGIKLKVALELIGPLTFDHARDNAEEYTTPEFDYWILLMRRGFM
jgi:hypothetical protein